MCADLAVLDLMLSLQDPDDPLYRGLDRFESRFLSLRHCPLLSRHCRRLSSALPGLATWLAERPAEARMAEKTISVTKTWETTYAGEIERRKT